MKNGLNNPNNAPSESLPRVIGATVCIAGGYLHATAPTKKKKGSDVYRLCEDNACAATIAFSAPLGPHATVKIQFSTGDGRLIDTLDPKTHDELPTKQTLENEQNTQEHRGALPSDCLSREGGFRRWKNPDGTLTVCAIASAKHWDTGRVVSGEPPMYRFDLLVEDADGPSDVHLHYCFDTTGKQLTDSGGGIFFAGSVRLEKWLKARSGGGCGGGGSSCSGVASAIPAAPASPPPSPRPLFTHLFTNPSTEITPADFDDAPVAPGDGTVDPAAGLDPFDSERPLADWTHNELMLMLPTLDQ